MTAFVSLNLSRGFFRLWVFFTVIWVTFCGWQIYSNYSQLKESEALLVYYTNSATEAKAQPNKFPRSPADAIITSHLDSQVVQNNELIAKSKGQLAHYTLVIWLVPVVALVFARGIPWIVEGFRP